MGSLSWTSIPWPCAAPALLPCTPPACPSSPRTRSTLRSLHSASWSSATHLQPRPGSEDQGNQYVPVQALGQRACPVAPTSFLP